MVYHDLFSTNRAKSTIYTVKPDLKGTSIQQLMENQPYIQLNITICCIDVPFKSGLTVYMVGLPRFVVLDVPFKSGMTVYMVG
jgi:hypothetical protein